MKQIKDSVLKNFPQVVPLIVFLLVLDMILLLVVISRVTSNQESLKVEPQAVNDVIIEATEPVENTQNIDDTTSNIEEASIEPEVESAAPRAADTQVTEESQVEQDPYQVIVNDIQKMKDSDIETIQRYFGSSDIFTPETLSDRLTASAISFVSSANATDAGGTEVIIHICTLDYNKMSQDTSNLESNSETNSDDVKVEVAKGVINGTYDLHYNIPVEVIDNQVVVTEQLKQALTGNWYKGLGVEIQTIECPLS